MVKLFSIKLLALLLTLMPSPGYGQQPIEIEADNPIVKELTSLAQSDANNNIDRRTQFIIELYESNSANLTAQEIRGIYDDAFSTQVKQNKQQTTTLLSIAAIALTVGLIAAFYVVRRKNFLKIKTVTAQIPFGIGEVEFETVPNARDAAWKIYVEMRTRIATQQLGDGEGLLREALNSLYKLFEFTRQILKEAGPDVGESSKESVGEIGFVLLNKGLRPFMAKWHPRLAVWESECPADRSAKEHEQHWDDEDEMRQELKQLSQDLIEFTNSLAKIAGVPLLSSEPPKSRPAIVSGITFPQPCNHST